MSPKIKTNFGKIGNQGVITFAKGPDFVLPKKYKWMSYPEGMAQAEQMGLFITSHEAFRRWKVARKAWRSRKWGKQLPLPL